MVLYEFYLTSTKDLLLTEHGGVSTSGLLKLCLYLKTILMLVDLGKYTIRLFREEISKSNEG